MRNINLFVNWFDSKVRPEEFEFCYKQNLKIFDKVINFRDRPTFNDFFKYGARFDDEINVIANLDIYFNESIRLAKWIKEDNFYCLTRHEDDGKGNIITFKERYYGHPGDWSQDAWIFTGKKILEIDAPFMLGERGCDNHLAWLAKEAGFKVHNPCLDIMAIHRHNIDRSASMGRGERVGSKDKYIRVPIEKLRLL